MSMKFDYFQYLVGQTILYCQTIEHDVKYIYAAMQTGDFAKNLRATRSWSLGTAVDNLRALDMRLGTAYLTDGDYDFLLSMTGKRNHICHGIYQSFIYVPNFESSAEYQRECDTLVSYHDAFLKLYRQVENVRLRAIRAFRGAD